MPVPAASVEVQQRPAVSVRRRCFAACIDFFFAVVLGLLASSSLGHWAAGRAAQVLGVGEPDSLWRGPVPLMLGAIGNLSYAMPLLLLVVVLPEAVVGVGPGKAATGLHILPVETAHPSRLVLRFLLKCAPCLAWCLALSVGQPWTLAVFVVSLLLFTGGCLPLLHRGRALHEWLAQTQVEAKRSRRM